MLVFQPKSKEIEQIARLVAAGAQEVVTEIESATSKINRPKFNQLLDEVRQDKIKRLIVTRLDRISRYEIIEKTVINKLYTQSLFEKANF